MDGSGSKKSGTGPDTRKSPWTSLKEVIQYLPAGGVKPDVYRDAATTENPRGGYPWGFRMLYANILLSLYFGQKRLLKDLGKIKTFGHSLFI